MVGSVVNKANKANNKEVDHQHPPQQTRRPPRKHAKEAAKDEAAKEAAKANHEEAVCEQNNEAAVDPK